MGAILNGSQLGIYSLVMLNKTEGKENWKEKRGVFYMKASSLRNVYNKFTSENIFNNDSAGSLRTVPSPMLDYLEQSD